MGHVGKSGMGWGREEQGGNRAEVDRFSPGRGWVWQWQTPNLFPLLSPDPVVLVHTDCTSHFGSAGLNRPPHTLCRRIHRQGMIVPLSSVDLLNYPLYCKSFLLCCVRGRGNWALKIFHIFINNLYTLCLLCNIVTSPNIPSALAFLTTILN